jgi:hypothetical protein
MHGYLSGNHYPSQEDIMSMEKRAVVDTDKEKTAHKKVKKDLAKTNTGKIPPKKAISAKGEK